MDNEKIAYELNDILSEFFDTACNHNVPCMYCEINNYRKKYSLRGDCSAIYLAMKLLGDTKDTAEFLNKQYEIFENAVCKDSGFNFCSRKCNIHDIRVYTDLLENRGSCFYTYLGTILLKDVQKE